MVAEHLHRQVVSAGELLRAQPVKLLVDSSVGGSWLAGSSKHFVVETVYLVSGIKGFHGGHRYSFAIPTKGQTINLRVGCEFSYDASTPTPVTVQLRPRSAASTRLVTEAWSTTPAVPVDEYTDIYGNPVKRFVMPQGHLVLRYDAVCAVPDEPDPDASAVPQRPIEELPGEVLHFTLPSRYCLSDELMGMAWELFGKTPTGAARVQAICDWVHDNIKFKYGTSNPLTTAADVLRDRIGVCRDLTHVAVSFCRAMNIPARY